MPDDITKEIDDLIGSLTPEPSSVENLSKESPKVEVETPKVEESVVTSLVETPKLDDKEGAPSPKPAEGEPATPLPTPAPKVVTEGGETEEELRERIKLLLGHIESLTPVYSTSPPSPLQVSKSEEKKGVEVPTPTPTIVIEPEKDTMIDFLGDISIDDIIDSKDLMNKLLNQVYQSAKLFAKEEAAKTVLSTIPELVSTKVREVRDSETVANDFFKANEDLLFVRKTVSHVAAQVHAEKPDLTVDKVLDEAAERTRKLLGIKKIVKNKDQKFDDPAFVDSSTSKKKSGIIEGLQKEIDDILTH